MFGILSKFGTTRFKKNWVLLAMIAVFLATFAGSAAAATYTFTGATDNDWSTANNWSSSDGGSGFPNAVDAVVTIPADKTVDLNQTISLDKIIGGENAVLNIKGSSIIGLYATASETNPAISAENNFRINGDANAAILFSNSTVNAGYLEATGGFSTIATRFITYRAAGGALHLTGAGTFIFERSGINTADATRQCAVYVELGQTAVTDMGGVELENSAGRFSVYSGGTLILSSDVNINLATPTAIIGKIALLNGGTLVIGEGTTATFADNSISTNGGTTVYVHVDGTLTDTAASYYSATTNVVYTFGPNGKRNIKIDDDTTITNLSGSGEMEIASGKTVTLVMSEDQTYSGKLTGGGSLLVQPKEEGKDVVLTLDGDNTAAGKITVEGIAASSGNGATATLLLTDKNAIPAGGIELADDNAKLDLNFSETPVELGVAVTVGSGATPEIVVAPGTTVTLDEGIDGAFEKTGGGTLVLDNASLVPASGTIAVTEGTLAYTDNDIAKNCGFSVAAGATLDIPNPATLSNATTFADGASLSSALLDSNKGATAPPATPLLTDAASHLTLGGELDVTLDLNGLSTPVKAGDTFVLFSTGTTVDASKITVNGDLFTVAVITGTPNIVTITAARDAADTPTIGDASPTEATAGTEAFEIAIPVTSLTGIDTVQVTVTGDVIAFTESHTTDPDGEITLTADMPAEATEIEYKVTVTTAGNSTVDSDSAEKTFTLSVVKGAEDTPAIGTPTPTQVEADADFAIVIPVTTQTGIKDIAVVEGLDSPIAFTADWDKSIASGPVDVTLTPDGPAPATPTEIDYMITVTSNGGKVGDVQMSGGTKEASFTLKVTQSTTKDTPIIGAADTTSVPVNTEDLEIVIPVETQTGISDAIVTVALPASLTFDVDWDDDGNVILTANEAAPSVATTINYTLEVTSSGSDAMTSETAEKSFTLAITAGDNPDPQPTDDDPITPDDDGSVDNNIAVKDGDGNNLEILEIPETVDNTAMLKKLASMGLTAEIDADGSLHVSGTATDIGTVELQVLVLTAEGEEALATVTIEIVPIMHDDETTKNGVNNKPADWTGTSEADVDSSGNAIRRFTIYVPLDLSDSDAQNVKQVGAEGNACQITGTTYETETAKEGK